MNTPPAPDYLPFASINGVLTPAAALMVSPLGAGFMFGEGIFETLRVRDSRPLRLPAHHARYASSAAALGAPPGSAAEELGRRCAEVISANALKDGSLKVLLFQDVAGWSELIFARSAGYPAARYAAGFRLMTVPGAARVDPLHALKTMNYLANLRARRLAQAAGFDEALFVDPRGQVLEGAMTNLFVVKDGAVRTPPRASGILPGVMRDAVLQHLGSAAAVEQSVTLGDLQRADEVFVTNALLGVMPVTQVDATTYALDRNPVTRALMAAL